MLNHISITGNMAAPITLRQTSAGKAVASLRLAYTPSRKTDTGWEDAGPTVWFDVTIWGEDAVAIEAAYSGVKGRATVTGRLDSKWWEKDGQQVEQLAIVAESVTVHPPRNQPQQRSAQPAQGNPWGGQPQQQGQQTQAWGGGGMPAGTGPHDEPPFAK